MFNEEMEEKDVIGKSLKDIRPNIDEYGLIDTFRNVWKTGEAAYFPAKVYVDDKYSNYYENRVFRLPSGEIVAIYDDVSVQENASAKIKASQERFDLAMKASRDGLFDWDLETNKIYYSPGWKSMLGYEDDEIPNDFSIWETNTEPEDVKRSWEMQQELIDKKRDRFELEFKMKHKDGHWVDILSRAEAQFDKNGKALRIIGTHVDICERVRSQLKLKQYASQLETLNTVTAALSTSLELDNVLELILDQLGNVIPFDSGAIFLYEKDGWHVMADQGITPSVKGNVFTFGNELFQEIRKTQNPLIVHNAKSDPRFQNWGQSKNLVCWMGIPLIVRDTLIGILTLDSAQSDIYSQDQADLALSFASQSAQAIENARLFKETTQRLERMDSLRKIDQAITSGFDLNVTLNILIDELQGKLAVDAVAVLFYEKKGQTLSFFQGQGFQTTWIQQTNLLLGQGYAGKVALDRRDIFIQNLDLSEIRALKPEKTKEEDFISYYGVPLIAKDQLIGVLEIFHRSLLTPNNEWISFLQTLAGQAAIAIDNITLYSDLQTSNTNLSLAYDATIEGWAQALEMRDTETEGHSRRVVETTMELARALGYSDENLAHLRRGALLHDIGKMGVPDAILQKPGQLTESEWQVMREHPTYAYKWLSSIDYLKPALDIPYCHHEKWDGTGYPRGLAGEKIPLNARIFSIVDVWDALRSDRPYRKAWSREKTLAHIQTESAKHFDPEIVDAFVKYLDEGGGKY